MSDEYIRSKFEAFLREANKIPNFFVEFSPERLYNWRDRVSAFLLEIFGEDVSQAFQNYASDLVPNQEYAAKKRYLAWLYERYQAQKNKGVEQINILKNQWPDIIPEEQWKTFLVEDSPVESIEKEEEIRIFIVHGHDNDVKEKVARFVEKLGFRAIILHEQPNQGRTIIEKFESFSRQVSFTIVLLTPDDIGAPVIDKKSPKYRARQNVIFEFGFFTAKLGRAKVCALIKGDIDLPSDYSGVIYIPFDEREAWRIALVKEMRNAGLVIDSDKLLR